MLNKLADYIHDWAISEDFWQHEYIEGKFNKSIGFEKLALIHSEISEIVEAYRYGRWGEDVNHSVDEEVADTLIRLLDFAAWFGIDVDYEIEKKMKKNLERKDHVK